MKTVDKVNEVKTNQSQSAFDRVRFNVNASTFDLYSTKLYENPEVSVIREYVANGIDSLIRAKKYDTPIIVGLPTVQDPVLRFRDFGTGIDKYEDVKAHVFDFNDSDKTSEIDSTGSLGLGAKSAYAVASQFVFTTYDGKHKRSYLGTKDEHGFPMCPAKEPRAVPCDEPRGVLVEIPVNPGKSSGWPQKWKEALVQIGKNIGHDKSSYNGNLIYTQQPNPDLTKYSHFAEVTRAYRNMTSDSDKVLFAKNLFNIRTVKSTKTEIRDTSVTALVCTENCALTLPPLGRTYGSLKAKEYGLLHFANICYPFDTETFRKAHPQFNQHVLHVFLANTQKDGSPHPIIFNPSREYLVRGATDEYLCNIAIEQFKSVKETFVKSLIDKFDDSSVYDFADNMVSVTTNLYKNGISLSDFVSEIDLFDAAWKFKNIKPTDNVLSSLTVEMIRQAEIAGKIPNHPYCAVSKMTYIERVRGGNSKLMSVTNNSTFYSLFHRALWPKHPLFVALKSGITANDLEEHLGIHEASKYTCFTTRNKDYVEELERAIAHLFEVSEDHIVSATDVKPVTVKAKRVSVASDSGRLQVKGYSLNVLRGSSNYRSDYGTTDRWDKLTKNKADDIVDELNDPTSATRYCYVPFHSYAVSLCGDEGTPKQSKSILAEKFCAFAQIICNHYHLVENKSLAVIGVSANDAKCRDIIGRSFFTYASQVVDKLIDRFRFAAFFNAAAQIGPAIINPVKWTTAPVEHMLPYSPLRDAILEVRKEIPQDVKDLMIQEKYSLRVCTTDYEALTAVTTFLSLAARQYQALYQTAAITRKSNPAGKADKKVKTDFHSALLNTIKTIYMKDPRPVDIVPQLQSKQDEERSRDSYLHPTEDQLIRYTKLTSELEKHYSNMLRLHGDRYEWYISPFSNVGSDLFRAVLIEDYLRKKGKEVNSRYNAFMLDRSDEADDDSE